MQTQNSYLLYMEIKQVSSFIAGKNASIAEVIT